MKRARLWATKAGLSLVASLPLIAACTPTGSEYPRRPSLLEPKAQIERQTSPGKWQYHPRQPARLARSYDVGRGKLYVGDYGERWLLESAAARAVPASVLAPEPLVGAMARGAAWTFIGASGTAYDAESPLGPFIASRAPLERLARVDSGSETLLAASHVGRLLVSDDRGGSWRAVGPSGGRFSDVLLAPPHALALEVPERLWWSKDEGRNWHVLDAPPIGAEALRHDADAGPVIISVLGIHAARFGDVPRLEPLKRSLSPDDPDLEAPPREGPSAKALALGRAFVAGGSYFEVAPGPRAETILGRFAEPLRRQAAPVFSACEEIRVAGRDSWVYAACTRERAGPTRIFHFFRSEDGGQSFEREPYEARGNPDHVRLAVGAAGRLLLTGLCLPQENLVGCRPQGIQQRQGATGDAGAGVQLHVVPTPALEEHAHALTFSADGEVAYAVGQRTKGDALFVFVARDLETGFTARPLTQAEATELPGPPEVHALTSARDGQISLVLGHGAGPQEIVLIDADGRTLSRNSGPVENASLGASGAKAIAVTSEEAWESLNGGAQWESIGRLPRAVCTNARGRCAATITCAEEGCAIGDSLSRLGWRGQAQHPISLSPPSWRNRSPHRRSVGKPFGCEISDGEWLTLRGVERMPDASQAALGRTAWYALSSDDATAGAGLWIADVDAGARALSAQVRYSELLSPSERAAESAYHATLQVEGAAAIRYDVPGARGEASTRLRRVEVAWENLLDNKRGRGVIPDAGPFLPGDFAKGDGPARRAQADLVSVTSGGIYVRVHRHPQHDQITYFLDGTTTQEIPALRWDPPPPKGASSEMARVDGQDVPLLFVNQGATMVRASLQTGRWRFDAMSVGFADAESFAWRQHRDIAYVAGQAGIHLSLMGPGLTSTGSLFPLQAKGPVFGAPLAVPTQSHLSDPAVTCSSEQRAQSPRIVAPHQIGARRPVLVHDPVEPLRAFLTDLAILHGTPETPCVAVFDAEPVRAANAPAPTRERALIDPKGPSWLFRMSPDTSRREAKVEYRRMQCKGDAELEVPVEIYEMPGTRVDD